MKSLLLLLSLLLILASPSGALAVTVQAFPGTSYDADTATMDAALGLTGLIIEDFEDLTLIPGLSIEFFDPNAGPITGLPKLFADGSAVFFNNVWDGDHGLVNTTTNDIWFGGPCGTCTHLIARITTFHIAGGTQTFTIGIGNAQGGLVDHRVLVNGVEVIPALENVPEFIDGIDLRNIYLRIDAEASESINSVSIELIPGTNPRDGLIFDHLGIGASSVPTDSGTWGRIKNLYR